VVGGDEPARHAAALPRRDGRLGVNRHGGCPSGGSR
jgi:hypothetical protein